DAKKPRLGAAGRAPHHTGGGQASLGVPVLSAHELHGLGEMAGERREFAGTVCEFLDRAQLLRGRRGDRLRLLGGRLGARARPLAPASWCTASSTTAKPRPCTPARAASIVALRASRLVWLAMNPIVSEKRSTCSATSRRRRTSLALSSVVTPRSVSRRAAAWVAWRTRSVVCSIWAPAWRVCSPAATTSPARCFSSSDSLATALTRPAASRAP